MKFDTEQLVKDRNTALFSFNKKKIRAYAKKYGVQLPKNKTVFWAAICKAICNITDAPEEAHERASKWLRKHNFTEGFE